MEEKDSAYQLVDQKYNQSKDVMDRFFKEFKEYERMYQGYIDKNKHPWKSKIFEPQSFEKVERVVAHLNAGMPRGRFLPRDYNDESDLVSAHMMEEIFKYQWQDPKAEMQPKLGKMIKSMAIFGISFGVLTWKYELKAGKKTDENGEMIRENIVTYDAPYFKDLFIYNCYPDPSAVSIETMEYFCHDDYVTLEQLKSISDGAGESSPFKNLKELEEKIVDKQLEATTNEYVNTSNNLYGKDGGGVKDRIRLIKYYSKARWITIAPDFNLCIEDRENPYAHGELPVHMVADHSYLNQLMGIGEIQPIIRLQKALNHVVNQRIDNVDMIMNPILKVSDQSKYANTFIWKPGQKWVVKNADEVSQFQLSDVTGNTFAQTTSYFKDSINNALGLGDVLSSNDQKTATEVRAREGEQNARLRAKEANIDTFIKRLVTQWGQLNQQYLTEERAIRIADKEAIEAIEKSLEDSQKLTKTADGQIGFLKVSNQDIIGQFDFMVETGSTTNNDQTQEREDLQNAIQLVVQTMPMLQQQGYQVDIKPLLERMLRKFNIVDTDDIFKIQEEQQQQMMAPQEEEPPFPEEEMPQEEVTLD